MRVLTEREAYIVMNLIQGIGPARIQTLINAYGDISEVFKRSAPEISMLTGMSKTIAEKVVNWESHCHLDDELNLADRGGAQIVTRVDREYPEALRNIPSPPLCLYIKGKLPENIGERSIAIVGTRRMTRYGREMTRHLTESAALAGWIIVSGMAMGVDAIAHESTLVMNGITVGVLGTGLGRIYPQENVPLARKIVEQGGALISEFPMMMPANARTFPMRNRIVAGLTRGTLVVEAAMKSGALITANMAAEYGKTVFAVPGQVDNPMAHGCHWLIKQGAKLTESADDIMEEFSCLPGLEMATTYQQGVRESEGEYRVEKTSTLSKEEELILMVLRQGEKDIEQISVETQIDTGLLLSLVLKMELKRLVRATSSGTYTLQL